MARSQAQLAARMAIGLASVAGGGGVGGGGAACRSLALTAAASASPVGTSGRCCDTAASTSWAAAGTGAPSATAAARRQGHRAFPTASTRGFAAAAAGPGPASGGGGSPPSAPRPPPGAGAVAEVPVPLPPANLGPWKSAKDPATGGTYWFNPKTQAATPVGAPKPDAWVRVTSDAGDYYWNKQSGTTTAVGEPLPGPEGRLAVHRGSGPFAGPPPSGRSAVFSLVTYPLAVGLGFGLIAGVLRLLF